MSDRTRTERISKLLTESERGRADMATLVETELRRLVALLNEVQPIRRNRVWPIEIVMHLAERQNWTCPACNNPFQLDRRDHHIDHITPWSLGGGNETANVQILHARCNLQKGARADVDEVIAYLMGRIRNI